MELREVMQKRKSIRQYLTTPVEEEKVKAMIEAAILAPTWKNAQEIRYYVAVSEEKRQAVLDALVEGNRKKTQNAPVFLISAVILNRAGFQKDGTADNELGNGWGYYDCGLHDMNLLLRRQIRAYLRWLWDYVMQINCVKHLTSQKKSPLSV